MVEEQLSPIILIMFWTILAMMLVLLYALKTVISTQSYIRNIDTNIEKMVKRTLLDEERILEDLEGANWKKGSLPKKKK